MPDILVEVRGAWLGDRKRSFLLAIHDAVIEALKSDPEDKVVRLVEHAPDDFLIPAPASDRFAPISRSPCLSVARSIPSGCFTRRWCGISRRSAFPPTTSRSC